MKMYAYNEDHKFFYISCFKFFSQVIFTLLFSSTLFSQANETLLKTAEYFNDQHKRRELYLDDNMKIKKEIYFESNDRDVDYKLVSIEYINDTTRKKVTVYNSNGAVILFVDFEKGIYNDFKENIFLKFKGDFIFDGIQKGNKIVVNYSNGKRNGRLIQTDSAINGSKIVSNQVADTRYLKFDIIKFYNQPIEVATFKLFNGIELNFGDDALNGLQKNYYSNSNFKFQAEFKNFKLFKFNSYSPDGTIVSKISTTDGFTRNNQIINGSIISDSRFRLFYLRQLSRVGKIIIHKHDYYDGYSSIEAKDISQEKKINLKLKAQFDKGKRHFNDHEESSDTRTSIRDLFGIPQFEIVKYDLQTSDDKLVEAIYFADSETVTNNPSLNNIKFYPYYTGHREQYEYLPLPYHEVEDIPSLVNNDYEENEILIENDLLEKYLVKAFALNVHQIISTMEETKKCLIDFEWVRSKKEFSSLKFYSNGNCEYKNVYVGGGGGNGLCKWNIISPGKVEISGDNINPYDDQVPIQLTFTNCNSLQYGLDTYSKK